MPEIVQEIGAYAGLASVVGLAVLSALYFSQARDVKRLREWAGRAPERSGEGAPAMPGRVVAQPQRPATAPVPTPGAPARAPGPPAVPGAGPRPAPATPAGQTAPAAATAATGAGPATAQPAKPAAAAQNSGAPTAAAAGGAAAPAKPDAANGPAKPGDTGAAPAHGDAGGPSGPGDAGESGAPARAGDAAAPAKAGDTAGAPQAGAAAAPPSTSPGAPPPASPAARSGAAARPVPPAAGAPRRGGPDLAAPRAGAGGARRPLGGRPAPQETVILPPRSSERWYRRLGAGYIATGLVCLVILGGAAAYGVTQLVGDDGGGATDGQGASTQGGGQGDGQREPRGGGGGIDPATVTVAVLNGTTVPGLAATLSDEVGAAGFKVGTITNFSDQQLAESVVQYTRGHEADARAVSRRVGISQREPVNPSSQGLAGDATVIVIAGADKAP